MVKVVNTNQTILGILDIVTFGFVVVAVCTTAIIIPTTLTILMAGIMLLTWSIVTFMKKDKNPYFPINIDFIHDHCSGWFCSLVSPTKMQFCMFLGGMLGVGLITFLWIATNFGIAAVEEGYEIKMVAFTLLMGTLIATLFRFSAKDTLILLKNKTNLF